MRWCTFDGKKPSAWLSVYFRKIVTQSLVMSQFVSICCMCHSLLACVCTFSTSNWQLIGNLVQVGGMCRLKIILSFAAFTLHLLNLSVTALHGTRFCVGNSVRESGPAPPSMFNIPPSGTLEIKILVLQSLKLCSSESATQHLNREECGLSWIKWLTMKTLAEKLLPALRIAHMHNGLKISITDSSWRLHKISRRWS